MKKLFRHVASVIMFSFVACLFLPLQCVNADAKIIDSTLVVSSGFYPYHNGDYDGYARTNYFAVNYDNSNHLCILKCREKYGNDYQWTYLLVMSDTTVPVDVEQETWFSKTGDSYNPIGSASVLHPTVVTHTSNNKPCYATFLGAEIDNAVNNQSAPPWVSWVGWKEFDSVSAMYNFIGKGDISADIPEEDTNTDNFSLDKSLGMVKNAHWRHLESKNELQKVIQDAMNLGTGTGDPGSFDYKEVYTRYAKFVQDKCSFATTSTTGVKIGGRYRLQYASRVGFTFAYNLPDILESTDYTKQYYKKFGSSKPYPIANGTNFDANQNIQSLFTQAYAWNDSLPSVGTWRRALIFKETKYWIDVRIIDTKNKTYGSWYAMDMETNKGSEVTTDNGDINGDITSDDPADPYTKIEGEGDTFQDAEDNSHDVGDHTDHYDQKWYDDIKDNTKKSAPAFKNLLAMVKGIPSMIKTLFSWLPSWVLELVSVFFALVIALALLRFVLGS